MQSDPLKPIYSSREHDPEGDETVNRFVLGLGERVDRLQDAELGGAFEPLAELARELVLAAAAAGYGALVSAAEVLEKACRDLDVKRAREATLHITEIAQRVRLGHKGAA